MDEETIKSELDRADTIVTRAIATSRTATDHNVWVGYRRALDDFRAFVEGRTQHLTEGDTTDGKSRN